MQQRNVLEYLDNIVKLKPEKTAFSNGTDSLTFLELYNESRSVASKIADIGLYNEPVVVFMRKHPKEIAAFFGTIYAGCFYVCIDDEMPKFRIDLILENLQPKLMICDNDTIDKVGDFKFDGQIVCYDDICSFEHNDSALAVISERQLDTDPIYVVFTSGSTGIPKGVVACHRSVIDYIENLSAVLEFNENTVFGNQTPLYFDACLKELYPTLKFGATTYLIPKDLFMFPVKLVEYMNTYKINTVCWVVSALTMISAFNTFDKVIPEYLSNIAFGSEVFPIKQYNRWKKALPNASFTNLYGPTEATGMSCYYKVNRDFELDEAIPIGRPFTNTEILLLDENNKLAPEGSVGEICIRGTALTLGYYHAFDKTNECFVQNPLNDRYPELIYRTGDLAKYNEYGELVFVSRKDYQIKHMGHRIELGEIEVNVNMLDKVNQSCCVYDKEKSKIVLFYSGDIEAKDLIAILKDKLPRYMLPNSVNKLSSLPTTPNGKLDRNKLSKMITEK